MQWMDFNGIPVKHPFIEFILSGFDVECLKDAKWTDWALLAVCLAATILLLCIVICCVVKCKRVCFRSRSKDLEKAEKPNDLKPEMPATPRGVIDEKELYPPSLII